MMHMKKREAVVSNTTRSQSLDNVLRGGKKETSAITKPFGESRSGKTQLPDTLCVSIRLKQGMVFSLVLHLSAGKTSRRSSL
ncbi:meiotic recombination protein DMC1 homolog [Solanum lycopersicum]|uniref:meiotic recombination protein DMC1 homolog n=1 Tax=Solanum lycopersicum TaxID=4081 RepID=UPI003749D24C